MSSQPRATPYNPSYDPLTHSTPGCNQNYAPTYWLADAGKAPQTDGALDKDIQADVVIIGSGYTGLSTAIFLAKEHGIKAVVLEANQAGFGCSTRNGGQAQCASGRLKRSQWVTQYGLETALKLHHEVCEAMDNFKELIENIDCDAQHGGHLYVAHNTRMVEMLKKETQVHNQTFKFNSTYLDKGTVQNEYVNDQEACGAMLEPEGISVQPAKLLFGLLEKARSLGVKVYTGTPVSDWNTEGGTHFLKTPSAIVKAKQVVMATGGYTSQTLHPNLKSKIMPILSNNMVTRVLSEQELESIGIKTGIPLTDTRVLRNYYRLLPGNRLQIGSRSAISGKAAPDEVYQKMLVDNMHKKFPGLKDVAIDYSWWGWVDVSHDMMPRIVHAGNSVYYALGYGGNGVMYSTQAGRRMAELVAGKPLPKQVPFFESTLRYPLAFNHVESKFFAPFRRLGQRFLYQWYWFNDERK